MVTNFWALGIGLAAAAAPLLVHWLTRSRPVRVPTSTLRFIRGAVQQRRARHRLRDLLVLLFRTAAILLVAAALARPLFNAQAAPPTDLQADLVRIVILDCSQSMGVREGGVARFERARAVAAASLGFRAGMSANLFLAGASGAPVFEGATTNLGALRDALESSAVRPERLRVQAVLNAAAEQFSAAGEEARQELVIFSDFQRTNWAAADFSVLPQECQIELKSVATAEAVPNLALLEVSLNGRVEAGRDTEVTIRVGNFSPSPAYVRVELKVGPTISPFEGQCPANSITSLAGSLPGQDAGWRTGAARIIGGDDALPADDSLPVAIHVHAQPRLCLLTRDRPDAIPSPAYFVERALAAQFSLGPDRFVRLDAADPDVDALRSADVTVIVRAGRLTDDTLTVLAALLKRGRGVLYFAADQLDAISLHELTSRLGASARLPVEFQPPASGREQTPRRVTVIDRRQIPFMAFGDELGNAFKSLEIRGGLASRPLPSGLQGDIRASFDDQAAFLVSTAVDRGRLSILNVDLERSNLPRTAAFVPLLAELISRELMQGDAGTQSSLSGEPATIAAPVGEEALGELTVTGPPGLELSPEVRGRLSASAAGVIWEIPAAGPPGVYQVLRENAAVASVATVIPAEEADQRTLPANVFSQRLAGGRNLSYALTTSLEGEQRDSAWVWLAVGCVFCLLLEYGTLTAFRS